MKCLCNLDCYHKLSTNQSILSISPSAESGGIDPTVQQPQGGGASSGPAAPPDSRTDAASPRWVDWSQTTTGTGAEREGSNKIVVHHPRPPYFRMHEVWLGNYRSKSWSMLQMTFVTSILTNEIEPIREFMISTFSVCTRGKYFINSVLVNSDSKGLSGQSWKKPKICFIVSIWWADSFGLLKRIVIMNWPG